MKAIPGWYYSKSWGRWWSWELYQDYITLNHGGEAYGGSYTRVILLQIMGERSSVRALPGWYYSKSWGRGWCASYARMILLQIMRERVVCELCQDDITLNHEGEGRVRAISGGHCPKSWGRAEPSKWRNSSVHANMAIFLTGIVLGTTTWRTRLKLTKQM